MCGVSGLNGCDREGSLSSGMRQGEFMTSSDVSVNLVEVHVPPEGHKLIPNYEPYFKATAIIVFKYLQRPTSKPDAYFF